MRHKHASLFEQHFRRLPKVHWGIQAACISVGYTSPLNTSVNSADALDLATAESRRGHIDPSIFSGHSTASVASNTPSPT